jgi:serine/threonine protein kinase
MTQSGDKDTARANLRLGKLALARGLITSEQLREVLSEQNEPEHRGRNHPRPLGILLIERKVIAEEQLVELLEELSALALEESAPRREDKLLSRILRARGLARPEHVEECLKIQADAIEDCAGPLPRLGELLIIEGHASEEAVQTAMAIQSEMTFHCKKCARDSRFAELDSTKPYCCPSCQGALDPRIPMPPSPLPRPEDPPSGDSSDSSLDLIAPEIAAEVLPAAAPPPLELERLGKYRIVRELGRGGMGVVYEALDTQLNRRVALKLMHSNIHAGREEIQQEVDRFVREARLAANLSRHPNIVSVYEAGVLEERHYIAMELVEGQSMAQWRRKGSVTIRHQVRLLRDVALAVHHAHQGGILHRDLKPQNVLVDARNKPFVTDFGLAKETRQGVNASLTAAGKVSGTPAYMSPEQAGGLRHVSRQSDVWSLGVMLYEVLAGRPPFRGQSPIEILTKVLRDPVMPPSEAAPNIARADHYRSIEGVCMKALDKDPGRRYPTAKAFGEDLSSWLKGDEVHVSPPSPRRLLRAAGAGAVAVLVALLVWALRPSATEKALENADRLMASENYDGALSAYEQFLRKEPGHPKALAGRERAEGKIELARARREAEEARASLASLRQQAIRRLEPGEWFVIGPFEAGGERGLDTPNPPEKGIDLLTPVAGRGGPVTWKRARPQRIGADRLAALDLRTFIAASEDASAYALIHIRPLARTTARLLVGSEEGIKVWLNGVLIHRNDVHRTLKVDDDEIPVHLVPGWNRFLMKVKRGKGGFGLAIRIVDAAGKPVDGLEFDAAGDLQAPQGR